MVSGFNTSPNELSSICSGDAKLMVIFEKLLFILFSFLNAILLFYKELLLIKFYAQYQTFKLMQQYVQRFGDAGLRHRFTLHDSFVSFGPSYNVI